MRWNALFTGWAAQSGDDGKTRLLSSLQPDNQNFFVEILYTRKFKEMEDVTQVIDL
jgi:hypothetical protein